MANVNKPFGFLLLDTEGKEYRVRRYPKTAVALSIGDPLMQDSTGAVKVATTGVALIGIAAESAAAATATIAVCDDQNAIYVAQVNGDFALADIFNNADIVSGSADALNSTYATTATYPFKILGLNSAIGNVVGSYAKVNVAINNALLKGGTGTQGV